MADMHLTQLTFQHNDAIEDEDDARDKYVARQLFRNLASEGHLATSEGSETTFRLFSEDLRPSNVLIDKDLRVVGVVDWEFAYAAPAQFSLDPPWWLLLESPEYWDGEYRGWIEAYEPRLETFLSVLEDEEKNLQGNRESPSISQHMRRNWENKSWIVRYAARKSWSFDFIFWRYLDPRYFGENEDGDYHARLPLLKQQQIDAMEPFVKFKMQQRKERILVRWGDEDAKAELSKVML